MTTLTLYNGDCLEVMKTLPDKSVDLILCDLPYGCLTGGGITKKEVAEKYGYKGKEGMCGCAWDIKINLESFWKEVKRIRKTDHSPTLHFCTTKFGNDLINSNPKEFRYDLVWDKQRGVSFLTANKRPMRSHEMVYVFSKAGAFYHRIDEDAPGKKAHITNHIVKKEETSMAFLASSGVLKSDMPEGKKCSLSVIQNKKWTRGGHPTEKPQELYRFLIERYCPVGGTVLDPTFGSGNSVFTAVEMGRNGIGIEKDETFFGRAEKRLEDLE